MNLQESVENEIKVQNTIENETLSNENIIEKQNKFLEGTFGKVINTGIDIALRAILPNIIEDEVIRDKKCNYDRWI